MARTRSLAMILVAVAGICTFAAFFVVSYFLVNEKGIIYDPTLRSSSLSDFQYGNSRRQPQTKPSSAKGKFIKGELCGGCYHALANPESNIRCGRLFFELTKKEGISVQEAAQRIATNEAYQNLCARCMPASCSEQETVYWRYDAQELTPPTLSSRIPQLQSIPASKRIPDHAINSNLTEFFLQPGNSLPSAHYLFEYNPSIVILPSTMRETTRGDGQDAPAYVASFRVSSQQSCFRPYETKAMYGGSWDNKPPVQNYLALALLRADLSVIQDVVVDIKASDVFKSFAEDFRLFVFRQQLYVASFDYITPIWIKTDREESSVDMPNEVVQLSNVFPSNLKVVVRSFPSCPVCYNRPNKRCGKNFNYFMDDHSEEKNLKNTKNILVELWPSGPHVTQQVNLNQRCSVARSTEESMSSFQTFIDDNPNGKLPSWYTMEEIMFPYLAPTETILTRARGGACCISIDEPDTGKPLRVGIYHTKIPKFSKRSRQRLPEWIREDETGSMNVLPNQYLSRWYAFEASPPHRIVAESGLFCFGYPEPSEYDGYSLAKTTLWKRMVFGGDVDTAGSLLLDCPRIHFVSGITEKIDDPTKVIVTYGINDCFSRVIEIEKSSILKKLHDFLE